MIAQPDFVVVDRRAIPAGALESEWRAPDGHAIRRFDWPALPGGEQQRGSLLFLPGRGDFYEKWIEAITHWHARGWAVTAIDWRGQAFSGRMTEDGVTGHISDYRVWMEDLGAFWREWSASAAGPRVLVAHSMGGQIALGAMARELALPDAAVFSAPMFGLKPDWLPRWFSHLFARIMVALRGATTPAWQGAERPDRVPGDRFDLLTHDRVRYADETWWREARPELGLGPPSWGWIERSLGAMAETTRRGALQAVRAPVLILATRADRLVSWRATRKVAQLLPDARLVAFGKEARHEILREADPVRLAALSAIDKFLDSAAPAR